MIAAIDNLVPPARRETVRALAREIDDTIGGSVRGQSVLCLVLAAFYAASLLLIGLKHAVLIGLAAGVMNFVPYLGSLTGLVIATCVAVAQFWPAGAWILLVPAVFLIGQSLADYVLAPIFVARRVHLDPVWAIFALFAFGYLFGPGGIADCGAGGRGHRRADPFRSATVLCEPALQRDADRGAARKAGRALSRRRTRLSASKLAEPARDEGFVTLQTKIRATKFCRQTCSFAVLPVADVLHPVDDLAVLRLLNSDMQLDRRRSRCRDDGPSIAGDVAG